MLKEQIIDQYTFLDYKAKFDSGYLDGQLEFWVGKDNIRRLNAYRVYESYYRNDSRQWLNTETQAVKDARREYGDPHVIVETALSSMLGEDQSIQVQDVDGSAAKGPEAKYQDKLVDWATKERFQVKMAACERKAVKLGDGVYVLGWNTKLNRPRLTVWDPGFYFPVWDEEDPGEEFPKTVHIAYDFEREVNGRDERFLRRVTWQLVDLVDEDGAPAETMDRPWNGDGPTSQTCLYSDMIWKYEDIGTEDDGSVYHLDLNRTYSVAAQDEDLEIDWIPVIHISNTDTDSGEHWGVGVLAQVMQVLDDLISTDTDLQAASATTGSPPLVIPDMVVDDMEDISIRSYGPGEVIRTTGDSSKAEMIDTSNSLTALREYAKDLLSRVSVNGRIPESLLGRVKPNEVPSGIALTLSFSPHSSMIREMRLIRKYKYQLLLKMVGRFYMQNEESSDNPVTQVFDADLHFGTFLPADRQETMTIVQTLYTAKAISLETAVRMLVEAGFPIDSVEEEVMKILQSDVSRAGEMLSVTGDVNVAREAMGLPPSALPVPNSKDQPGDQGTGQNVGVDKNGDPQLP